MTLTELEQEVKKLPLADRATLLARVQLTDEELDELDDARDVADPTVASELAHSRAEARAGRTRPFAEFMAEVDAEAPAKRGA